MKAKLIPVILFFLLISCGEEEYRGIHEHDMDLDKIKREVKDVVSSIYKGCEEVNQGMVLRSCYHSPDFTYLFNGRTLSYEKFSNDLEAIFKLLLDQDITIMSEKIAILDENTVLYTTNLTFFQKFKDGSTNKIDPASMLFIFRKTGGRWMWIYGVESYGQ